MAQLKISKYDNISKILEFAGVEEGEERVSYNGKLLSIKNFEQEDLDQAFVKYKENLEEYLYKPIRLFKAGVIRGELVSIASQEYSNTLKRDFLDMLTVASAKGMTNRISYITSLFDSIEEYIAKAEKKLSKLSDVHKILGFKFDTKKFQDENPNISTSGALEIKD
jgi:hypothetical protein